MKDKIDSSRPRRWIFFAILSALLLLAAPAAFSQSCALCYTQAASSGTRMIQALQAGILILVIPPTFGSLVVIGILYRKRNHFYQADANNGA